MKVMIWKYDRMKWDDGFGMLVKWMLKVVFEENLVSEIGKACLLELGCKNMYKRKNVQEMNILQMEMWGQE